MGLHNLKPASGSVKSKKRIARGQGSGKGGTSTRGHKGAKSRSGYKRKRNFEGGQMPLSMRLPKRGFKNPNREAFVALNLGRIQEISEKFDTSDISVEMLVSNGIIHKNAKVKVLAKGEISAAAKITAHAVSAKAKELIESKGGSVTLI